MSKRRRTSARKIRPAVQAPTCPRSTITGPKAASPAVCPVPSSDPFTSVRLALRPVDDRSGLPFPAMNEMPGPDGRQVPGFLGVLPETVDRLASGRLCAVCGDGIVDGQYWFLGGPPGGTPVATFHPPAHEDCLVASLGLCPYLGRRHARRAAGPRADGLTAVRGQSLAKPETWVLGVVDGYLVETLRDGSVVVVHDGYLRERRFHYDGSGRLVESTPQ